MQRYLYFCRFPVFIPRSLHFITPLPAFRTFYGSFAVARLLRFHGILHILCALWESGKRPMDLLPFVHMSLAWVCGQGTDGQRFRSPGTPRSSSARTDQRCQQGRWRARTLIFTGGMSNSVTCPQASGRPEKVRSIRQKSLRKFDSAPHV